MPTNDLGTGAVVALTSVDSVLTVLFRPQGLNNNVCCNHQEVARSRHLDSGARREARGGERLGGSAGITTT